MKSRRIMAVILTVVMLAAACGPALASVPSEVYGEKIRSFGITDVDPNSWGAGSIVHMYEAGIMAGDPTGKFRPDDQVKFIEAVATVSRVIGIATKLDTLEATLQKAITAGIVTADQANNPHRVITRLEMGQLLAKVLDIKPKTGVTLANMPCSDTNKIPQDQWGLVAALYDAKVFKGFPDKTFRPSDSLTRVQLAVLMERLLGLYKKH